MPGRGTPPSRLPVSDLWGVMIACWAFGSFFVGAVLSAALLGTPKGGNWAGFWAVLFVGGFVGVCASVVSASHLSELVRRRAWVPPGTARHPILMAIALSVLFIAVGAALLLAILWVSELAHSPLVSAVLGGGFGIGVVIFAYEIGRRLARKPPASEGNGATEPSPPAERPP